jgi:hypothetical protein
MPEETTVQNDGGETASDAFDPQSLGDEAKEYIRKQVQSESDAKAAAVEKRLRDEQAARARSAVETAEENELRNLATSGQHEALGQRVASRLEQRSAEERAIGRASDIIEGQIANAFTEALGAEKVESIRQEVIKSGGAHAEFAAGLAKATEGETRSKEIADEVKAQLIAAGVQQRDETAGGTEAATGGQTKPPSTFAEIEQAYVDGNLPRKAYEEALEARDKGR